MRFLWLIFLACPVFAQRVVNPYLFTTGGGGGGGPFTESQRFSQDTTSTTDVWTLSGSIATGKRAVACLGWEAPLAQTLASVADSKGNTWTVRVVHIYSSAHQSAIADANIVTALAPGDTITVTYGGTVVSSARACILTYLDGRNATQPDTSVHVNDFDNTAAQSITTGVANSIVVSSILVQAYSNSAQAASINFVNGAVYTQSGTDLNFGTVLGSTAGLRLYCLYKVTTSTGTFAAGGQFQRGGVQNNESYSFLAVSYKP